MEQPIIQISHLGKEFQTTEGKVRALGDINLDQWVMLEKVAHTWENDVHTMEFETYPL